MEALGRRRGSVRCITVRLMRTAAYIGKSGTCEQQPRVATGRRTPVPAESHIGKRFGRWTVVKLSRRTGGKHSAVFLWCKCDCGTEAEVRMGNLTHGRSGSCGCLKRERSTTHGKTGSRPYAAWCDMLNRCSNPRARSYKNYGARGIRVCERWRSSFELFLIDMGEPPPETSIDRVDVNGHYEKSNCRWATVEEQQNNRRNNRRLTLEGKTLTVAQWARELSMPEKQIAYRLKRGWPVERVLEP